VIPLWSAFQALWQLFQVAILSSQFLVDPPEADPLEDPLMMEFFFNCEDPLGASPLLANSNSFLISWFFFNYSFSCCRDYLEPPPLSKATLLSPPSTSFSRFPFPPSELSRSSRGRHTVSGPRILIFKKVFLSHLSFRSVSPRFSSLP